MLYNTTFEGESVFYRDFLSNFITAVFSMACDWTILATPVHLSDRNHYFELCLKSVTLTLKEDRVIILRSPEPGR